MPKASKCESKVVYLHVEIHPEVRKRMGMEAKDQDVTIREWLHNVLCHELKLMHLYHQVPGANS